MKESIKIISLGLCRRLVAVGTCTCTNTEDTRTSLYPAPLRIFTEPLGESHLSLFLSFLSFLSFEKRLVLVGRGVLENMVMFVRSHGSSVA